MENESVVISKNELPEILEEICTPTDIKDFLGAKVSTEEIKSWQEVAIRGGYAIPLNGYCQLTEKGLKTVSEYREGKDLDPLLIEFQRIYNLMHGDDTYTGP